MKFDPIRKSAFTLIEVTLALGVAAFCLLAIFGLLPIGLRSNQAAVSQTQANRIISSVAADLRATPTVYSNGVATSATSAQYQILIPNNATTSGTTIYFDSNGQFSSNLMWAPAGSAISTQATHRLTVSFIPNPMAATSGTSRLATYANLMVSWPAASGTANAAGSVQTFIALDRN